MALAIEGRTAIITGASTGIGLAIATRFLESGAKVMLADAREEPLAEELDRFPAELQANARIFAGDLRQKLTHANLISAAIDEFDRIDILVNASRSVVAGDPLDPSRDCLDEVMSHNVYGSLRLSQLVAKRMQKQAAEATEDPEEAGAIINLSSISSQRAHPELMAYAMGCAAIDQMTRALAVALAPSRIRVNGLAVGSVMSASMQDMLAEDEQLRDRILQGTPLNRIAEASKVADVALFLASDTSSFVTGQILTVDGGRSLVEPIGAAIE